MVLSAYLIKSAWPQSAPRLEMAHTRADETAPGGKEFLSYRTAIYGLIISAVVAIIWMSLLGMTLWMAVLEV